MNKTYKIFLLGFMVSMANCAWGGITKSSVGGQPVVFVARQGVNMFNMAQSGLDQCGKWLGKEGVSQLHSLNNYGGSFYGDHNVLDDSLLHKGPFSFPLSTTRIEGCSGIGSK
jgi:hypothetical protein